MVVTSRPTTSFTDVMQARTASLSTITVQAPQNAWPQPNLVPVNPISSRRYQSSGRSGSPSQVCSWPFIFTLIMIVSSLFLSLRCLWRTQAGTHFPSLASTARPFPPGLGIGGWLTNLVARPIGLTVWVGLPPALSGWVTVDWRCEVNAIRNHVSSTSQGSVLHHPFVKSGASPADGDFGKPSRSERAVFN